MILEKKQKLSELTEKELTDQLRTVASILTNHPEMDAKLRASYQRDYRRLKGALEQKQKNNPKK